MTTDNDRKLSKAFESILEARNLIREILDEDERGRTEYRSDFINELKDHNSNLTDAIVHLKNFSDR